jgi:hypothetical protein
MKKKKSRLVKLSPKDNATVTAVTKETEKLKKIMTRKETKQKK